MPLAVAGCMAGAGAEDGIRGGTGRSGVAARGGWRARGAGGRGTGVVAPGTRPVSRDQGAETTRPRCGGARARFGPYRSNMSGAMRSRIHRAKQYRSVIPGVGSMMFVSNHHFPRHSHDQFGAGVIASGGQRSWSGIGTVRASAGDVIMVNPCEMHDGEPLDGFAREWRIIYLDPAVVSSETDEEFRGPSEIVRPVARDPLLA